MQKHATARFIAENRNAALRYIHKYYLPQELRASIYPADIEGIRRCFDDRLNPGKACSPEKLPDCVVTYTDIGMKKQFDEDTIRHVLTAYINYYKDYGGELTDEENRAATNLNHWLIDWEKQLLAKLIRISEEMERQVRSGDCWLTDYEIEVTVCFYVRDDDPFSDKNMPDSWRNEIECDSQLLCEMSMTCHGPISTAEVAKQDYYGIGDSVDHNERRHCYEEHERPERHCLTFHELCDHKAFPMKDMGRIGYVHSNIAVQYQNGISIDLKGGAGTLKPAVQ